MEREPAFARALGLVVALGLGCKPGAAVVDGAPRALGDPAPVMVPQPAADATRLLEEITRAKDAQMRSELYEKSRRFLALFPEHPSADDVRYDLALELVAEHLRELEAPEADEARALLDAVATNARRESLRFDAALVRLKVAKPADRTQMTAAILSAFPNHPDLDQVYEWWVQAALEEGDTVTAGRFAEDLLGGGDLGELEGFYRDVITRARLIGHALPRAESLHPSTGKVVVLDFFASWCEPCLVELPRLKALYESKKARGLAIVSVSLDEDPRALAAFVARERLPWTVMRSPRGAGGLADLCAVSDLPTYVVLDRQGIVRATDLRRERFEALVESLLERPAPSRR